MLFVRKLAWLLATALMALPLPSRGADAKEIMIHEGPDFSSPSDDGRNDLKFVREFAVDAGVWQRQLTIDAGRLDQPLSLSAEKAIELARASAESGQTGPQKNVTKLELLTHEREEPKGKVVHVPFYLIEMMIDGSDVQRVVLMDGTVIKSSLRAVKTP